ncbi:hypothetical protein BCR42DRAFT_400795 [Absidia repens]|uniref:Uncharacterized protein n=1 Tax=Absidia repens TaxID=90262 RepID=A0A1X2J1M6_9FUNG|nr:hypothetical protein BCR42DRAFT_400795 [Absidia repens]
MILFCSWTLFFSLFLSFPCFVSFFLHGRNLLILFIHTYLPPVQSFMTLPSSSRLTDTDPPSTITAQTHTGKRKRTDTSTTIEPSSSSSSPPPPTSSKPAKRTRPHLQEKTQTINNDIERLETTLDHLKTDCILIDVVLKSLQSFFPIRPMTTDEQLDQVDKELGLAYDDMLNQIRALYRNVVKLDRAIKSIPSSHVSSS